MNYLKNKFRVRLVNLGTSEYKNYILDASDSEKSALKTGDILYVDTGSRMERMRITDFYRTDGTYNGKKLELCVYGYIERNGKKLNLNTNKMKTNKMMGSVLDKFKNLYMPEVAENLRISMNGLVCAPVDGEYVSIDTNGELVSFPESFTIEMPLCDLKSIFRKITNSTGVLIDKLFTASSPYSDLELRLEFS